MFCFGTLDLEPTAPAHPGGSVAAAGQLSEPRRGGAMAGGRAPRRRPWISPSCAPKRKVRPWARGGGEVELTTGFGSAWEGAERARGAAARFLTRRDPKRHDFRWLGLGFAIWMKRGSCGGWEQALSCSVCSIGKEIAGLISSRESYSATNRERRGRRCCSAGPNRHRKKGRVPAVSESRKGKGRGAGRAAGLLGWAGNWAVRWVGCGLRPGSGFLPLFFFFSFQDIFQKSF